MSVEGEGTFEAMLSRTNLDHNENTRCGAAGEAAVVVFSLASQSERRPKGVSATIAVQLALFPPVMARLDCATRSPALSSVAHEYKNKIETNPAYNEFYRQNSPFCTSMVSKKVSSNGEG